MGGWFDGCRWDRYRENDDEWDGATHLEPPGVGFSRSVTVPNRSRSRPRPRIAPSGTGTGTGTGTKNPPSRAGIAIEIDGLSVELVDTAGLREDPDRIEAEGIRRAREALKNADGVLWIKDASAGESGAPDEEIPEDIPVIVLRNKIDITDEAAGPREDDAHTLNVSAKTGAGIDELRETIRRLAGYKDLGEGAFTARRRHVDAIALAAKHFERGKEALDKDKAGELFAEDLRLSHEALGEITGSFSSDDLLGRIFSEFCIGK